MIGSRFWTIVWLKWRLAWNASAKRSVFEKVLTVIVAVQFLSFMVGSFVGSFCSGIYILPSMTEENLLVVWSVIVMIYVIGQGFMLFNDLQQPETLSLKNFLHLPVTPFSAFFLNYLFSMLNLFSSIFYPAIIGFALAHVFSFGLSMWLTPVMAVVFLALMSALIYQLKARISLISSNKRYQRGWVIGVSLGVLIIIQVPFVLQNTVFRKYQEAEVAARKARAERLSDIYQEIESGAKTPKDYSDQQARDDLEKRNESGRLNATLVRYVEKVDMLLPPNWLALGVRANRQSDFVLTALLLAGQLGFTLLSLFCSYRNTLKIYRGELQTEAAHQAATDRPARSLVGRKLLWIDDRTSTLITSEFVRMIRSNAMKIALAGPVLLCSLVFALLFAVDVSTLRSDFRALIAIGVGVLTMMAVAQVSNNTFGLDRNGLRCYLLSPIPRGSILLGKNMAQVPILALFFLVQLALFQILMPMKWSHTVAVPIGLIGVFLGVSIVTNLLSMLVPYEFKPRSMLPKNNSLFVLLSQLLATASFGIFAWPLVALIGLEIFAVDKWGSISVPIFLSATVFYFLIMVVIYRLSLVLLAKLLVYREQKILDAVTGR